MPEVTLRWMITNGFLFLCEDGEFRASQQCAARITDAAVAFDMLEAIRVKYHSHEWNLTLEVEKQHA
jgi:hypothetical protein